MSARTCRSSGITIGFLVFLSAALCQLFAFIMPGYPELSSSRDATRSSTFAALGKIKGSRSSSACVRRANKQTESEISEEQLAKALRLKKPPSGRSLKTVESKGSPTSAGAAAGPGLTLAQRAALRMGSAEDYDAFLKKKKHEESMRQSMEINHYANGAVFPFLLVLQILWMAYMVLKHSA